MRHLNLLWVFLVSIGVVGVVAAGYVFKLSLLQISIYSLSFYGVFTVSHFLLQMVFAYTNRGKWKRTSSHNPAVSVVISTYREDPDLLRKCLESVANQDYEKIIQVILSNDGDDLYIQDIFDEVSDGRGGMDIST